MDNQSVSFHEFSRPLLMPSEITQLSPKDQIVFVAGFPPILAKKLRYYEDPQLAKRVLEPAPLPEIEEVVTTQNDSTRIENLNLKGIAL